MYVRMSVHISQCCMQRSHTLNLVDDCTVLILQYTCMCIFLMVLQQPCEIFGVASPSVSDEQRKDPSSPKDGDVDPLPDDWEMNDNDSDNEVLYIHTVLQICTVNCKCLLNLPH